MDYRLYHAINEFVADHDWIGQAFNDLEMWAVPVFAVATFALWLLARPGGDRKWKLASASALASAAVALLINQVIGKIWHRERPFAAHPSAHVWGSRSHDPSFPSDHASAAFAIAFTVLFFDRLAGCALPRGGRPPRSRASRDRRALSRRCCRRLLGRARCRLFSSFEQAECLSSGRPVRMGRETDRSSRRSTVGPAEQGSGRAMKAAAQKVAFDNGGAFIRETRRDVEQYLAHSRTRLKGLLLLYAKAPVAIALTAASWAVLDLRRSPA